MRSRLGVVVVVVAAMLTTSACGDDGPADDGPTGGDTRWWGVADAGRTDDPLLAAVAVRVNACRPVTERGAGLLVAPDRVLTAAHVVAGATSIRVIGRSGDDVVASVVAFDPVHDLAVLDVPAGLGPHLPLAVDPPDGAFQGEVVLFRRDGAVVEPVEILRRVTINTEDIYRADPTSRPGYELRADIAPGDSGGVVVVDGEAVAVVWSRSRLTDGRAWAIDPIRGGDTLREQLATGRLDDVDLDRCA